MDETWKPVVGYEGLYEVSDYGRVRSVPHEVPSRNGVRVSPGRMRNPFKNKTGYVIINLCKNGIIKNHTIHRLVAEAFLPNPDNLPQVNHKDENKLNNNLGNLEWCSVKYNNNYGTKNQRVSEKNRVSKCKQVAQIKDGIIIAIFPSTIAASHITDPGHISSCALGKQPTAGGFEWKYV